MENVYVDFLAKLASSEEAQQMSVVAVETLFRSSIDEVDYIMKIDEKPSWMTPYKKYLLNRVLPKKQR